MRYRSEIDGMRTLAVLPVVGYHMGFGFLPAGFLGVDVFFVISGFLIGGMLFQEISSTGALKILDFYERRLRRILPALLLMVLATYGIGWFAMTPGDFSKLASSIPSVFTATSNIYFQNSVGYFSPDTELDPLIHTWSLSVEEQFYFLFPFTLLLVFRFFGKKATAFFFLFLAGLSLFMAQSRVAIDPNSAFYLIEFRAWELLLGAVAAFAVANLKLHRGISEALSLIGLAAVLASYVALPSDFSHPSVITLWPVLGSILVLVFAREGHLSQKILSLKPLVFVGILSYSIYLWHQPILAVVRILSPEQPKPVELLLWLIPIFGVSYLAWRYVENPFRNRGKMSKPIVLRNLVIGFVTLFGALFVVQQPASAYTTYSIDRVHTVTASQLDARMSPNYGLNRVCKNFLANKSKCTSISGTGRAKVALWGDSFAMHVVQALQSSSTKERFIAQTLITCNPIEGIAPKNKANGMSGAKNCNKTNTKFMNYLMSSTAKSTIRTVILASHWENILLDGKTTLDNKGHLSTDSSKPRVALQATIRKLQAAGYRVVVFSSPAYVKADTGACLRAAILRRTAISKCDFPKTMNQSTAPNILLRNLVTGADKFVDLTALMCPNSTCFASVNGNLIYRDRYHLAREGSAYLGKKYDLMGLAEN